MTTKFLTDEKGKKIAAVVPIEEYVELMEDLEDLAAIARQRNEKGISFDEMMKNLKLRLSENEAIRN
jgi:phosphoglucomutase